MDLAEELERLAPFGKGNPEVRLLVPSAKLRDVQPMGEEGRHARFSLVSAGRRAVGVAFGAGTELEDGDDEDPGEVAVALEVNRWNGTVAPRVVLRERYGRNGAAGPSSCAQCPRRAGGEEWWERLEAERSVPLHPWPPPTLVPAGEGQEREVVDRRGHSGLGSLVELVSSGEAVLALCADASRRRELVKIALDRVRLGTAPARVACGRCADRSARQLSEEEGEAVVLADWAALARTPDLPTAFEHVLAIDPLPFEHLERLARRGRGAPWAAGWLHLTWGADEVALAGRVLESEWELRPALGAIYRKLRSGGDGVDGERLAAILAGQGKHPRSPELAGRCIRVLCDLSLVQAPGRVAEGVGVVSSKETELERSPAYMAYRERHEEGKRFLATRQALP
jgi:single-stranded-DNA-specific exonuclease